MDPVTSGWLFAALCAGTTRPHAAVWPRSCTSITSPDRVVSEPYVYDHHTTRPPASYAARSESIKRLRELRGLKPGWDGSDASTPSGPALQAAEAFIQMLPAGLENPRIGLAADGELGFFWEGDGLYIDLGFADDGTLSYYATVNESEYGDDGVEFDSEGCEQLIAILPRTVQVRLAA